MGTGHYQMGRVVWGPRARAPARQSFLPEGRPGRDGHHHPLDDIGPDSFALLSVLSGARPTRPINFVLVQGWRNGDLRGCAIDMFLLDCPLCDPQALVPEKSRTAITESSERLLA